MTLPVLDPKNIRFANSWRKTAAAVYTRPTDGRVSGFTDLDFRKMQAAMERWNSEGHRVTPLHVTMAIVARILGKHVPELNCYMRWGSVHHRGEVVVSAAVLVGKELTQLLIHDADNKSILELAAEVNAGVQKKREGTGDKLVKKRGGFAKIPWPFRRWIFNFSRWLSYEVGIRLPGIGMSPNMFGSVLVSNIGPLGLDFGIPALMPASNLPLVLGVGRVQQKPMVENGEVIPMMVMPLSGTFDHRVVDGAHVGRFAKALHHYLANPEELLH